MTIATAKQRIRLHRIETNGYRRLDKALDTGSKLKAFRAARLITEANRRFWLT